MFAELLDRSCSGVFVHQRDGEGWNKIYANAASERIDSDQVEALLPNQWEETLAGGAARRIDLGIDLAVQLVPLEGDRIATILDPLGDLRPVPTPDAHEDSPDMYLRARAIDGEITHCNQALAEVLEDSADEIVGLQWEDLFHPDSLAGAQQAWRRLLVEGNLRHADLDIHLTSGDKLPVSVSAKGQFEDEELTGAWFVLRDVSEQRQLEARLLRAERLDAVGRLTAGVAHDFNNLLQVVLVYTNFLVNQHELTAAALDDAQQVLDAAKQAGQLTSRLLVFSQQRFVAPRDVDINGIVEGIASLMRKMLPENIAIQYDLAPGLQHVLVDPSLIEQVIVNLLLNARDSLPAGGVVTIATETVAADDPYARHRIGAPDTYSVLQVTDMGQVIGVAERSRIFEPDDGPPRSAGLGLFAIKSVIQQCGGHIWVESTPETGTTFRVYLPNSLAEVTDPTPEGASRREAGGTELVLLVEDDVLVRWTVTRMLKAFGYQVHAADNVEEALTFLRDERPALIVTDVVMPDLDGPSLVRRAREIRENLPAVMISGYAESQLMADVVLDSKTAFLPKPFLPNQLVAAVRQMLDAST